MSEGSGRRNEEKMEDRRRGLRRQVWETWMKEWEWWDLRSDIYEKRDKDEISIAERMKKKKGSSWDIDLERKKCKFDTAPLRRPMPSGWDTSSKLKKGRKKMIVNSTIKMPF
ncbi:hypothetical protein PV325_002717 [Microctonus aethiopoides]|nr:hypothetical protein PV325_002717 [Microctonus aethiopoides]